MPLRARPSAAGTPEPPVPLPPGRIEHVPGRGEMFLRDSGGDGPPVLLLHGWMFPSDLNWYSVYGTLRDQGYRVLAVDHRGHGRGIRSPQGFSLRECATDAAALVEHLGCGPVTAVGYSMGGPIACLMARDHPAVVSGLVLCATARDWKGKRMTVVWKTVPALRLWLGLFPTQSWDLLLRSTRMSDTDGLRTWVAAELSRGSTLDIVEAGRELSEYDARPWIEELRGLPSAVVVTARDRSVPPRKQRALAEALGASVHEIAADHMAVVSHQPQFRRVLLEALDAVGARASAPVPVAA